VKVLIAPPSSPFSKTYIRTLPIASAMNTSTSPSRHGGEVRGAAVRDCA
jgi:hypothetical protein